MSLLNESFRHPDLLRDMSDGCWLHVGLQAIELRTVLMETSRPVPGKILKRSSCGLGITDRLVVHIRKITNVLGFHSPDLKHPTQNILKHEGAEVPYVRRSIYGGSTAVIPERFAIDWL